MASSAGAHDLFDGPCTVYSVTIDNTAHGAVVYGKLYESRAATSASTPDAKFYVGANDKMNMTIPAGWAFTVGFSVRVVTGTADNNTVNPGANVLVQVVGV